MHVYVLAKKTEVEFFKRAFSTPRVDRTARSKSPLKSI